ncbi:MAG: NAD(P)/FAD-dependent oxidoreductase [Patescibacteria group bacterium]
MKIAIVGAGMTGLTTAYRLSKEGCKVVIFEKENYLGGLARGLKKQNWEWGLEVFFHHIFTSDKAIIDLITELGLGDKLFFTQPKTALYLETDESKKKIFRFDSPSSVLQFTPLSILERIRVGLATAYLKSPLFNQKKDDYYLLRQFNKKTLPLQTDRERIAKLTNKTAENFLRALYGRKVYELLWKPLLRGKFGQYYKQVSASWIWARIKKRSSSLGYLKGGFQVLIDALASKIEKQGGTVKLGKKIKDWEYLRDRFDAVVFTGSADQLAEIAHNLPRKYKNKLKKPKMMGALCLILELNKSFLTDGTYWLNINESDFPFVALVEHTNFVSSEKYGQKNLLYVGGYYPPEHKYFRMEKKQVLAHFSPYLRKINPNFKSPQSTEDYHLTTSLRAQPIVTTKFLNKIPQVKTPLPNVYLVNMQTVYPWDRGMNYAVQWGSTLAEQILQK